MGRRVAVACALVLAIAATANAQAGSTSSSATEQSSATAGQPPPPSPPANTEDTRPATTTFFGDTGIWFVPTAEVVAGSKWAVSGYRRGTNFIQGYTNVGDFAGTFAVGIKDRAEIFGSFLFDTRIDRDVRPTFTGDPTFGGFVDRYPKVNRNWTGDHVGDFYVGAKVNLWSEYRQNPAAVALRGIVKLPTADSDVGNGTGKADFLVDAIVSKEAGRAADVSAYAGWEFRSSPDNFDIPTGAFRWGAGVAFPSRSVVRPFAELNGVIPTSSTMKYTGSAPLVGADGSRLTGISYDLEKLTRATVGVTFQARGGFFVGGGVSWNLPQQSRNLTFTDNDQTGDYFDWQVRIGYHPGTRVYVAPPPPPPPPPPPAPQNRAPTVKAQCDPCSVEVGKSSTVTANAQDPDGDTLTYRWSAPSGTLQSPSDRSTLWTASQQEGTVPVTVTVDDGKGGTASDTVNIQVTRPPVKNYTFEDVHFDFDRYSLRPEATRILDEAVNALRTDPTLRVEIEGHTCSIGTAEYNLALGERRANAVRDYLVSRGVDASRLHTVSYGEERPKYDNSREETRRLNRRAALVVNLQR